MSKNLVILSCSATKLENEKPLPAVVRYDGPLYKVLHSYLRDKRWPDDLSISVLSAKHGLIGGLTQIDYYDQRMSRDRAIDLRDQATSTLLDWSKSHTKVDLILGKDYLPALNLDVIDKTNINIEIADGPIGIKLSKFRNILHDNISESRREAVNKNPNRPLYFLPDWDDMLDSEFDFIQDKFSHPDKSQRKEIHVIEEMKPRKVCDGVLVSLAQIHGTKGLLKKFEANDIASLAPQSIKKKYGLTSGQLAFGDCGAFSYVNEPVPTVSVEQTAALYQLYGFDFGASVDHIPVPEIKVDGEKKLLTEYEKKKRINITRNNAAEFLEHHRSRKYSFIPVGVIQGTTPKNYINQLYEYIEMGYRYVAFGGLVPRGDRDIANILYELKKARKQIPSSINNNLWIHLFGIYRPKIQSVIREAGISSFDSATYFRKAWLRSDQNYLGIDDNWYAAIRVPPTSDPRTLKRLENSGFSIEKIKKLENRALNALHEYDKRNISINQTISAVMEYDSLLTRNSEFDFELIDRYTKTLESRIWEKCLCSVCTSIGIDTLIFRGSNRNKRRGAHNTYMLFSSVGR